MKQERGVSEQDHGRGAGYAGAPLDDDEIDLLALFGTLWRGKFVIALCALVAVLAGGYYAYEIAVPKYAAQTTLALQVQDQQVVDLESVISGVSTESEAMATEVEVMQSRAVLGQLVDRLDLTSDPEFNARLRPEPALSVQDLKDRVKALIGRPVAPLAPDTPEDARNRAIDALRGAVTPGIQRGTYVFTIRVETESRAKSLLIANTLAEIYIQDQIEQKFQATEGAVTWLSERVVELEAELLEREDEVDQIRAEADFVGPEQMLELNQQAREVRARIDLSRADMAAAADEAAELRLARDTGDVTAIVEAADDPTLRRIATQLEEGERPEPDHPFWTRLDQIISLADSDVSRARVQVEAQEAILTRLTDQIDSQSEQLAEMQQMQRELDATAVLYETFLTRLKETTVQQGIQTADARILSEAASATLVAPRTSRILALTFILGGMIGCGIVLLRNMLRSGFRTSQELQQATGLAVLGQVPKMPVRSRAGLVPYLNDKPTSAAAEAVRNLRTSILMSNLDNPPQVIGLTSSIPGEGKTTHAIALAHNLAGLSEKKVLLIEGDIRRLTLMEYFPKSSKPGLLTAVRGDATLDEVIITDPAFKADLIAGEKANINAADAFSSNAFATFIEDLRGRYDHIIIDTPPVLVVPDARVIGKLCDAMVYVVQWDKTSHAQVQAGIEELRNVRAPLVGVTLSRVDGKAMRRYGYGGRYGAYSAYGRKYYGT